MSPLEELFKILSGDRHLSYLHRYLNRSFSQEGEDLILRRIFAKKERGFYVDIGAHHPFRFSNTSYFYEIGWSGINIDPAPGSMRLFKRFRERDINLELAVGSKRGKRRYFIFSDPALNTFDENLAKERERGGSYRIIDVLEIEVLPLADILDNYLPSGVEIDFMNVDVEGMDLEVLKSNNWDKYRPHIILVEILPLRLIDEALKSPSYSFLREKGYRPFAKTFNTWFFIDEDKLGIIRGEPSG